MRGTSPCNTRDNVASLQKNRGDKFHCVIIALGNQVRTGKSRRTFKKGYLPSWTQEIFIVTKIIPRVPPVYRLRDYADNEIEGVFYAE